MNEKLILLKKIIKNYESTIIAFSGGLDSGFLLKVALEVLGKDRVLAVTAFSQSLSPYELADAVRIAYQLGARHRIIITEEMDNPNYVNNSKDRCYHCKDELFSKLELVAAQERIGHIAYGAIVDDLSDTRPGMKAARDHSIISPLLEAGLTKAEIRFLASGLSFSEKPAAPCLSSRVPYGEVVTPEKLRQIDEAEQYLKTLGYLHVRVRHHGMIARIEVAPDDMNQLVKRDSSNIVCKLKEIGFTFIALDLRGYSQGSLNQSVLNSSAINS